ncbi:hypothetical protein [Pseudomonas sp. Q2-TVG4-2]|uniref:hypothetical protein n=1 Tax=Pseudomonas sp. Q2-TVG4-2 TaxID=1685699 RepID=UPI0015E7072B|nr:hypothetical protein [Pseudomonas sp. Q2-TVG4-2]
MPPRTTEQSAIIRFWHTVELLNPESVPKLTPSRTPGSVFIHEIPCSTAGALVLAWSTQSPVAKRKIAQGKRWSHQIYGRCFDYREIVKLLEAKYQPITHFVRSTHGLMAMAVWYMHRTTFLDCMQRKGEG